MQYSAYSFEPYRELCVQMHMYTLTQTHTQTTLSVSGPSGVLGPSLDMEDTAFILLLTFEHASLHRLTTLQHQPLQDPSAKALVFLASL